MIGVKEIVQEFDNIFSTLRKPANVISTIIMLCAMVRRPGLSCIYSTSKVIQDIEKQGCPTGPLPDGSPNLMNQMIASVICEVFRAIKEDANLQIGLAPGSLTINATGANAGGPVTCVGTNITPAKGVGLIQ